MFKHPSPEMADGSTGSVLMVINPEFCLTCYNRFQPQVLHSHFSNWNSHPANILNQECFYLTDNLVMVITSPPHPTYSHHSEYLTVTDYHPWRISITFPRSLLLSSPCLESQAYLQNSSKKEKREVHLWSF